MSRHIAHLLAGTEKKREHRAAGGGVSYKPTKMPTIGARNTSFAKAQGPSAGKPKSNGRATAPETDMDGEMMRGDVGKGKAPKRLATGGMAKTTIGNRNTSFNRASSISAGGPKSTGYGSQRETDMDGEPMPANASKSKVKYKPSSKLGPDQATGVPMANKYRRGGHMEMKRHKRAAGGGFADTSGHDEVTDGTKKTSIPGLNSYRKGGRAKRDMGGSMQMPTQQQNMAPPQMGGNMGAYGQQIPSPYKRGGQPSSAMPYSRGGEAKKKDKPGMMIVIGVGKREKRAVGGSLEKPMYLDNPKKSAKGTNKATRGKMFTDA
jgi:hypothetical protein